MKEQNNIEGTVDKTSLKCKGVLNFFKFLFSSFVTTVAPQPSNHLHPSPLKPFVSVYETTPV